ncbi:SpvB/TcaC N-terminal domain-containing protein [Ottowia sp.]|uniref:SpvB/TcaC N-terminal domain-containing protein n=1 Tax=Ottowia sp. TaxID=1898956 RepID=UPI0025EFAFE4|nr:SpvB/TcaC N-terminal domain-containing protein [Ottowia sp.]MBK6748026.1 toxin [Ottowia sp.]
MRPEDGQRSLADQGQQSPSKSASSAPAIQLPKGGGAIRGIGEKFAANPVTGTGSMSVPIATSPGRSGFGPQLSLSYDSGAGNGPFGFGWSLSAPSITRKTDKGLPQYNDAAESDVFVLSGAEDLVPLLGLDGKRHEDRDTVAGYTIHRYRPRVEGLFARIERWTRQNDGDVHWRSISKDNILTLYGGDENSRIADLVPANPPAPLPLRSDPHRVFSWLICETRDDKGNAVVYGYRKEDATGVDTAQAHERNRTNRGTNRYLKRIRYGNQVPLLDDAGRRPRQLSAEQIAGARWMFEAVFDYGDHDADRPQPRDDEATEASGAPSYPWPPRPDAFSSCRAGFELRTYRLCRRVLMFHHFPGEDGVGADCLVRSTDFTHSDELDPGDARNPVYTFLKKVTQTGYRRSDDGGYLKRSLPPVEFDYAEPSVQDAVEEVDPQSLENLPIGLDGSTYRWTDLHGEGVPGLLTEQAGAWYYKRNLSPIPDKRPDGREGVKARFAPLETVTLRPNAALGSGAEFMDLAGDGQPDVVVMDGPMPGLYEHDDADGWQPFRPFTSRLNRDFRDPNLKLVDLDGDGHADVLITEDDAFVWHASLAEEGFGPARRVAQALDEEKGPRIVFADGTQSIHLADLSGDGLTDIVRIRNGEVCYWPNLGYGRFGAKVTMDHAPWFDHPDQFDPKRIRLADIDGSGTTDIIYLHRDGVRLYFNQSGNGWSEPHQLKVFPRVDDVVSIVPVDLLGNGTACLVWSSPLPGDARRPMRYVNLMGERKPHLLVAAKNNLGAETRIEYAPSTRFYLQDKRDGKPWITRLPFPVHVVERVETWDRVSRNRFVTRYTYHHGHFDGEEREFRGFGRVEQWDTEEIGKIPDDAGSATATNLDAASYVPPVHTRTWFHTGACLGRQRISRCFEGEYFRDPGLGGEWLDDTVLPPDLSLEDEREACRALKGAMLRQEVYALDGSDKESYPYTITEQNFEVRRLQPRGANRHAVFFTHPREALNCHYERNPADPRIQHALTLEVDEYGNVLKEAAVGYGRRTDADGDALQAEDRAKQRLIHITCTENGFTHPVLDKNDDYRAPLPAESRTYEVRKADQERSDDGPTVLFDLDALRGHIDRAGDGEHEVPCEDLAFDKARQQIEAGPEERKSDHFRRLIEHVRTVYRKDDLSDLLPLGHLEPLALPGESYKLAFTAGLLTRVFDDRVSDSMLQNEGGYVQSRALKANGRFPASDADDCWWIPSGLSFFSRNPADSAATELAQAQQHLFLPRRYRDPFGQDAFVDFDANDLLPVRTEDAVGNTVAARNDYRVLQPVEATDPNGNRSQLRFDALGMVVGTAVMGKAGVPVESREGDTFDDFNADLAPDEIKAWFDADDPRLLAHAHLGTATTRILYDLHRVPACAATIVRETHVSDLHGAETKLQLSFSYSDGFGREVQKKIQAEPGPAPLRDADGSIVTGADDLPLMTDQDVDPRWVGSGWTVFNNKGKPVRQFEPFFSDTHMLDADARIGVSPWLFHDPVGRVVATLHPNHTWEKVVFDPWQQTTWDVNDTALKSVRADDPERDPDVAGFFGRLPEADYRPTWHELRTVGEHAAAFAARYPNQKDRENETDAATKAEAHAGTPTTVHFDALGRPFLTLADNGPDPAQPGEHLRFATRVELDIEGNQREVRDAIEQAGDPLGRIVMRYACDMLGNRIHQLSMEAGARWMLNDVAGQPLRAWDSRGHEFHTEYDALRRPVAQTVRGTTADSDPRTVRPDPLLIDRIEYGESVDNAEALNLRTRVFRHSDAAGIAINARLDADGKPIEAYDFKGNLLRSTRRLASDPKAIPDWAQGPALDVEAFEAATRYDALNRVIQSVAPHSNQPGTKLNVIQPRYNEANLLERVDVWLQRGDEPAALIDPDADAPSPVGVADIDHDAKGQRTRIDYKTDGPTVIRTTYAYDPQTFRLTHLYTRRGVDPHTAQGVAFTEDCDNPAPPPPATIAAPAQPPEARPRGLQNLHYAYDPAGNITHIRDDAQQTLWFRNHRVEPSNEYTYDALYRLIQATGREHLGQGGAPIPHSYNDAGRTGILSANPAGRFAPNDVSAMGTYTERYVYDAVGNFEQMKHQSSDAAVPGWTRSYAYDEASLIENGNDGAPLKTSNRLGRTTVGNGPPEQYAYDPHGNMLRMPQLQAMQWDYRDQLQMSQRQKVNDEDADGAERHGERTWYVYDAAGQRVRKVTELANGGGLKDERIYLGGFEIHRRHSGNHVGLLRETLHLMDDKQRIALVETRNEIEDGSSKQLIRYQFGNHLGSAVLELDEQAQIVFYEEYTPYGSSTYQAVRSQTETAKRYRYTGKERDEESGLYYHGARYYAAWLGRWTRCDPAGMSDATNLYLYPPNPVRFVDPAGTDWVELAPGGPQQERSGPGAKGAEQPADPNQPPPTVYGAKFFEVGSARKAFLHFVFGAPFQEPDDPFENKEWKRGEKMAEIFILAQEIASRGRVGPPGTGPSPELVPAGGPRLGATPVAAPPIPAFHPSSGGGVKGQETPSKQTPSTQPTQSPSPEPTTALSAAASPTSNPAAPAPASPSPKRGPGRLVPAWETLPREQGTKSGRGVTPKIREKLRDRAKKHGYQGDPKLIDAAHQTPHSQSNPGDEPRLFPQHRSTNRSEGRDIARANEFRRRWNSLNPNGPQLPIRKR